MGIALAVRNAVYELHRFGLPEEAANRWNRRASLPGGEMSLDGAWLKYIQPYHPTPPYELMTLERALDSAMFGERASAFKAAWEARAYLRGSESTGLAGLVQGATAYQDMVGRVFGEPAWISVADRLPEDDDPRWLTIQSYDRRIVLWAFYSLDVWWFNNGTKLVVNTKVFPLAWMPEYRAPIAYNGPLPAPPEAAEVKE